MNLLHISFCVGFIYHRHSWKDQVRKCRHLDVNRCVNNFLGPVTSTWNNENNFFFWGFIFKFPVWVSHLSPGKWWKFPWRNLTFSLFCCWSADRSSAAGSVVTIIICHTHTTRWIYSLRNNKWRHIFFLFFLLAWLVRRCDENDSSGAWRRWPSDVCWLPTAFVAWRFSYTVENKVLICNLVIQSTRKTQQDEDESESETSHKPNGMWVHQKQIEKIKGESRKKNPFGLCCCWHWRSLT